MKAEITWFPQVHQVVFDRNNSEPYLHSVWIGLTVPLFNLPTMIWNSVIVPSVRGLIITLIFCACNVWAGLRGHLCGRLVALPELTIEVVQNKDRG